MFCSLSSLNKGGSRKKGERRKERNEGKCEKSKGMVWEEKKKKALG
jgi:hypothetical protein